VSSPRSAYVRCLRRAVVGATVAGLLVSPGASASPLPTPALAIAPPQAATVGFGGPYTVAVQGQALSLLNLDTVAHTITSEASVPKRIRYGKRYYTILVPLFDSRSVAGLAAGDVKGVAGLKPGSYHFLCSMHTGMKGTLVVQPSPLG